MTSLLMAGSLAAAFAAGMVAFFAPCCAGVMMPAYLAAIGGGHRFRVARLIEQVGSALPRRGIQLVSITPDSTGDLEMAARDYGITTPLISDSSRQMSEASNTLGLGMHADAPGHAFALIYHGKVLWYRDYYLAPYRTMHVDPKELLAQIPSA